MTFVLTGTAEDHLGRPLPKVEVQIIPSPEVTVDTARNVVHYGGGSIFADDLGAFTAGELTWAPGLTYIIKGTSGSKMKVTRISCDDFPDGATVRLADVTPAPAPSPMTPYVRGASAYEVWLAAGNEGTVDDYHESLRGEPGQDGATAATVDHDVLIIQTGA